MSKDIKHIFNTYLKELPTMVEIFNSFCGTDYLSLNYKKNLQLYFITQKLNDVEIESLDSVNFDPIENKMKSINFKLININEKTFNKDTFEEPEYSYQRMNNADIKEFLFPQNTDNKEYIENCNATQSIDYETSRVAYLTNDTTNKKYQAFINDYNITNNDYNSNAYFRLGVKEDRIIENEIVLECDDLQYFEHGNSDNAVLNSGIYGFMISYKDGPSKENATLISSDKKYKEIPIMLYQYAKPTYSNYNKIRLVFNVNGLFGVV